MAHFAQHISHASILSHLQIGFWQPCMLGSKTGLENVFLLYFHNMITAIGAENLESLMKAELSTDVCGNTCTRFCFG